MVEEHQIGATVILQAEKTDPELVKTLKKTKENLVGELYPILEAADGEIVDGHHRKEAGWESRRQLPQIQTKLQKLIARVVAHQRRTMKFEERRELYDEIAEELIKTGVAQPEYSPNIPADRRDLPKVIDKMAEILGVSEHSVAMYISDKYKRGPPGKREELVGKNKSKRSVFEIRGDLLEELSREKGGVRPTNLMYRCNLSWRPLTQHIAFLYKKNLLDIMDGRESPRYFLTKEGREVLGKFIELRNILLT